MATLLSTTAARKSIEGTGDVPIPINPGRPLQIAQSVIDEQVKTSTECFAPIGDGEVMWRKPDAKLILEDGTVFEGWAFGAKRSVAGEVVFNTGMVGYPEALTDPSYRGQILVLTYPLVGNYGVPTSDELDEWGLPAHFESDSVHITALVTTHYTSVPSHYLARQSLSDWLEKHNVPGIHGIDTRALTKKIRTVGAMLGKVVVGEDDPIEIPFDDPNKRNLVAEVSRKEPRSFGRGNIKIIGVDCGMKNNIIRYFCSKGIEFKVVPWNYDFTNEDCDGLFLSNGPGDPSMITQTIANIRRVIELDIHNTKPIFGICLGNQLLALAAGAKTYKMRFGNRGMNQPCMDMRTSLCYITPQNHGYAVDSNSLPDDWQQLFINTNDNSNEGLIHLTKPFFSVQFHPEHMGGPADTEFLFDMFLDRVKDKHATISTIVHRPFAVQPIRRVLLIGSGGLSIGQAGEFDYSGSQAIKALKEESIYVILINPNIATVQTSSGMADRVYFLPITREFVEQVIEKEKPDGILLQFGGQTALNCGIQLEKYGVLMKHNVRVLGTSVSAIEATEDREIFASKLAEIGEKIAPSKTVYSVEEALNAADKIGYPVLARAGFALGGLGSGFAEDRNSLEVIVSKAFASSTQVIIDKSLKGWKEIEYEVVRDAKGNCITVCNMENFDPLGIHTGDSIVVAPSQTLTNREYYMLRSAALKVIRHLGVVGECNIQYALDPVSNNYCIIEVNARLSRSSALASKATGYPLAYVAAKLALGMSLTDVANSITKCTTACFEPSLDYVVVKIPRWDMRKFNRVSDKIGSSMKSVGEVMAIGRTFEECFQKAIRMVDISLDGYGDTSDSSWSTVSSTDLESELSNPSDQRVFALAIALQRGYSVDKLYELTKIDKFFLAKLRHIILLEKALTLFQGQPIESFSYWALVTAKRNGFSDAQIARCIGQTAIAVRNYRWSLNVRPFVKQIDTLAAEFPAQTNYLYLSYNGSDDDIVFSQSGEKGGTIVLGCGAYRIGSSCEFDWCAVSCIRTLRAQGYKNIMINYNPETVSTDFDECDRLYFEELSFETVLDIYTLENSVGVVVSVGGQIPNNLAVPLWRAGVRILGTSAESIDTAENRHKFSKLMDKIGVDQPEWRQLTSIEDAQNFSEAAGYPVLVRPSYVLSGAAMNVASTPSELDNYLSQATKLSPDHPVVVSKFIVNAKEIEYDGVAKDGRVVNYAISEHVENAGVHSGDATMMLPAQKLYVETIKRIKKISLKIAAELNITGPFNIQFLSKNNDIKVIECNLRASRSLPFVSKTFNVNFVELATRAMVDAPLKVARIDLTDLDFVCIKVPMFSFTRLSGADPVLRVEMSSTGEVACFGSNTLEAFMKGMLASGFKIPKKAILLSIGPITAKTEFLASARILLSLGFVLYATKGTAEFLNDNGVPSILVFKPTDNQQPNIMNLFKNKEIDLVINVPSSQDVNDLTDGYTIRRTAIDNNISLLTNIKSVGLFADAMAMIRQPGFRWEIRSLDSYMLEARLL